MYQALYKILNNPVYIGRITHKDKTYEGQQPAIISTELWDAAQAALKAARGERVKRHAKHGSLLTGKCFSVEGHIYTPTYTTRGSLRYRYYIDKKTQHRIQSQALEVLVTDTLRMLAAQAVYWRPCWASNSDYSRAPNRRPCSCRI